MSEDIYTRHPNTEKIGNWIDRMIKKINCCGVAIVEGLALYMSESGNEYPSDNAVRTALEWEGNNSKIRLYCGACQQCEVRKKYIQISKPREKLESLEETFGEEKT